MLENKKIRNPFPKMGLVFKYEFLSCVKIFLPVYIALLAVSFITGCFMFEGIRNITTDIMEIIIILLYSFTSVGAFIITIVFIEKRFKKSMLESEAYFNLSLPVSIFEHITGRLLAYTLWSLILCIVFVFSGLLLSVSEWKNIFTGNLVSGIIQEFNLETVGNFLGVISSLFIFVISIILLCVTAIFLVNTCSHLVEKCRTLIELVAVVILVTLIIFCIKACMVDYNTFEGLTGYYTVLWRLIGINAFFVLIQGFFTGVLLKNRMNLTA